MPSGITGASITTLTNGTTANASDVMASLNSLKTNGVNNDSGNITTDNSGGITAVKYSTANGQIRGFFFLATPYLLANNSTINSGVTNNYTCTGGATGVPSGAKAVLLEIFYTPSAAGTSCKITPHSTAWSAGQYPLIGTSANGTNIVCGNCWTTMDGSGVIDVLAGGGNLVGIYIGIRAYLI